MRAAELRAVVAAESLKLCILIYFLLRFSNPRTLRARASVKSMCQQKEKENLKWILKSLI